ncbi:15-hydroxyprostaglandin dehydrogenase [NAD] [Penicillium rolfsii]|nr:15-hydroxyprostaglandin dehydrogenase [NAD] [Penicillium rolfsii]
MRTIVVTGGASGIGLGITRNFITQPDTHIAILDVNTTSGVQVLQQLQIEFPSASVSFEQCDVSSWESQATAFEKIYAKQGRIDVVFANAGISREGNLLPSKGDNEPMKPNLTTMNVNLVGVIYTVNLATYYMYKNATSDPSASSNGLIVCTASNAGLYPFPVAPLYASTKSGVIGLVRSLARRLEQDKIRINALAPAVIETNIAPSADLFKPMILTPMSTATKAVAQFVADESLNGKIAEVHGEHVTFAEPPAYVDEDTGKNIETFWNLGYA